MRKFVSILTVGIVLISASAYAATEVLENFNSYASGTNALNNPALGHSALGNEAVTASIVGDNINNSIQIDFSSGVGQGPNWFSFGAIQMSQFGTPRDLTGGATLSFDIKTDIAQTWAAVLTPQLTVWTFNPSTTTYAYETWRLQNYSGQVWDATNQPLLDLTQTDWTTITVDVADLIFNGNEQHWKIPDFSNVVAMDIILLQVNTDIVDTGTVLLDNIQWSGPNITAPIPEPGAMLLCAFGGVLALIRKKFRK